MAQEADYYSILGVDPAASLDTIRAAFTALLKNLPKDIDPTSSPAYQQILQAYKVLSDPKRRSVYDALLSETIPYALSFDIQASRSQLELSNTAQIVYLLLEVRTPEQHAKSQRPLNLCLVIDRSTSMRGARLERVISAIELVVSKLTTEDVFSVVSFSDRAEVVFPAGHVENSRVVSSMIRGIEASGGTEIFQGLSAGIREMRKVSLEDHTNHLILLTDGHTYGDESESIGLAQEAAALGIPLNAMGIGTEWNDQFLDELVSPAGGQSIFVETPKDIIDHLQKQISGLGQVYARNVRFLPRFPKSISLSYSFKLKPFAQPLAVDTEEIVLGDIEGQTPLAFLLELKLEPQKLETRINVPLNFLADIPSWKTRNKVFKHQFHFIVKGDAPRAEPTPSLIKAVRVLNMYRLSQKAMREVEEGQLDQAATRMGHLSTRLLEEGQTQLAQQAYAETQRLLAMGSVSDEGRKKLKYGTRALLTQAMDLLEYND